MAGPTAFLNVANNAASLLAAEISAAALSMAVTAGDGTEFPAGTFHITIDNEIILVTTRSADDFTITRAQEGTSAAIHLVGAEVRLNFTAKHISDLGTAINTLEALHPTALVEGRVVFAGADGILTDDSDFTFDTVTLTVTEIIVGAITAGAADFHGPVVMTSSLDVAGMSGFGAPVLMHSSLGVAGETTFGAPVSMSSSLGVAGAAIFATDVLMYGVGYTTTLLWDASEDELVFTTTTAVDPKIIFKHSGHGTAHEIQMYLDEDATHGAIYIEGLTASQRTCLHIKAVDTNAARLYLSSGANSTILEQGGGDNFSITTVAGAVIMLQPNADTSHYFKFDTPSDIPTIYGVGAYLRIGDVQATQHSLNAEDDLMVSGKFEVSGVSFFDSMITVAMESETGGANAIWISLKSTGTSGDLTGIRSRVYANAESAGMNVRGGYLEAKMGGDGKYAAMLEGALIHADYSAGNATISGDVRGLTVHISTGTNLSAANLYGILLSIQTRGSESITTDDVGLLIRNQAVGGNGRMMDSAITLAGLNMGGSVRPFAVDITFQGGATLYDDGTWLTLANSKLKVVAPDISGIVTAASALTMPAFSMGGILDANGQNILAVNRVSGRTTNYLVIAGEREAVGAAIHFWTPGVSPGWADTIRCQIHGGAAEVAVAWEACNHTGLKLGDALTLNGQAFDAGADSAQINTTGNGKGLEIKSTQDGIEGARLSLMHYTADQAVGDEIGQIYVWGNDGGGTLYNWAYTRWEVTNIGNGTEAMQLKWALTTAGSRNIAMTLSGAGALWTDLSMDTLTYKVSGTQVVSAQGAAVANPTDSASTQARLIDLLGRLRTHGLIAT